MPRLIDADALLNRDVYYDRAECLVLRYEIENAPTIEAVPVKHGKWVNPYMNRYGHPCHCCSVCGFKASYQDENYCPDCGAKMDLT